MECESCGCPYVTNAPDGDIRFEEPFELNSLKHKLHAAQAEAAELRAQINELTGIKDQFNWQSEQDAQALYERDQELDSLTAWAREAAVLMQWVHDANNGEPFSFNERQKKGQDLKTLLTQARDLGLID